MAPESKAESVRTNSSDTKSKQERVIAMLREGTTIAAIMAVTGWQAHSVRGFFAGVVRKRLKLPLTSNKAGLKRIYRIAKQRTPTKRNNSKRRKS